MSLPPRPRRFCALAIALLAAGSARAQPPEPAELIVRLRAEGPRAVTGDDSDSLGRLSRELRVREVRAVFRRPDGLAERARAHRNRLPARVRAALPPVPDLSQIYRIALAPGADVEAAAARYAADPHVVWAQPSHRVSVDLDTNDPLLASSGSWGQPYEDLWGILRIRAPEAWDVTQGEGITVAVVDTGIDPEHPDLAANLWVNPGEDLDGNGRADDSDRNGVDDDANGFVDDLNGFDFANSEDADGDGDYDDPGDVSDADPFDDFGHGTHVAGTIAAVADNGIGVAGVAPRARLMALKGFRASGSSPDALLARAMVYAAMNGARVINNSWSCSTRCPSNPVVEEAQAFAASLGVVVVTSAGNRSDEILFFSPKPRRDNIVVAASDQRDRPAIFSNTGFLLSITAPGSGDFFAPGFFPQRAILSTRSSGAGFDADGGGVFTVGGEYLRWVGTSMSAPHVSGLAALILAHNPGISPDDVRAIVRASARDVGVTGHDRATGAGIADAARAVQLAVPAARAGFSSPAPGAAVKPEDETVVIRGFASAAVVQAELAVGIGRDPAGFTAIPLADPLPADEGVLARWDVSGLADGTYLLRLAVSASDGSEAVEFLPLAIERNAFTRLSSPGAAARAPAISGRRVVWESERALDDEPLGLELFASDFVSGAETRVVSAPGDQRSPSLSGDRLAWIDGRDHASDVFACRLRDRRPPCREQIASAGPELRDGLSVTGDTLLWSESDGGPNRLRACTWRGGACRPLATPASPGRQLDPILSGTRLWWREEGLVDPVLLTCAGFPQRCEPASIDPIGLPTAIAASAKRIAWTAGLGRPPVFVCSIAPDGSCPARRVGTFAGGDVHLAVSGHRVVWSAPGPGGDLDIYLCEDDPYTGECPVQRITGSAATQRNPDVSGNRVVWEDERDGPSVIAGFELPLLAAVSDRTVRAGRPLEMRVRGRDPAGGVLVLTAVFADGTPLADRAAVFIDRGDGTGTLRWTPRAGDAGSHVVTFAGQSAGRLTARRSARIDVLSSPRAAP